MELCTLPISISVAACAIASQMENTNDMLLLAATLVQLGDTLATIAAQRAACSGNNDATTALVGVV